VRQLESFVSDCGGKGAQRCVAELGKGTAYDECSKAASECGSNVRSLYPPYNYDPLRGVVIERSSVTP
jgi:hypothetical protein